MSISVSLALVSDEWTSGGAAWGAGSFFGLRGRLGGGVDGSFSSGGGGLLRFRGTARIGIWDR